MLVFAFARRFADKNNLRIIPLGGLEEIGRNMTLFEYGQDIVIVDMGGKLVSSSKHKPTSELLMHLNVYHERKDINAVVHTHSPITTGFAFAEEKIERLEGFEGYMIDKDGIATMTSGFHEYTKEND